MPRFSNLFRKVGRRPVETRLPTKTRSPVICSILQVKSSCIVITSDSIRCTSLIEVMRRPPSSSRSIWITRSSADETCWRTARSGISKPAIITIVSRRPRASRAEFAWTVESDPSWPVFIAWSMSSASAPRTSPMMIRSGRMRRLLRTRSRIDTSPSPSMFGGRDSSRRMWRWWSWSSAESSIVTIRSVSGIPSESTLSRVVFPEPVPPEIRMFSRAWMQRSRNSSVSVVAVPRRIRSWKPSRFRANFRIVTSGPVSESGGMIALIRLPSGSRASTMAELSSTRRPTWATILLRIRRRCESSWKRTEVCISLPWRSTQTSYGPLTMISETVSSASSRSSGPWPRMSSAISMVIVSRSERERPLSCVRWRRMSARTRSRSVAGSTDTLKSCGPRSEMTSRWTLFFSSACGSVTPAAVGGGVAGPGRREPLVEIHYAFLPKSLRLPLMLRSAVSPSR